MRLEALATVNKKLKEIRARGKVNVEEDNKKAEKVAAKEKVREEKAEGENAEKEAVKMKGKAKPMVGAVEPEAAA